jgi:hypothetical protein
MLAAEPRNFSCRSRVVTIMQHRSTVVDTRGNIRKRTDPAIRPNSGNKLPEPEVDHPAAPQRRHKTNGAMAQQSGDSTWSNQYAPQKLLHLVGCREPRLAAKRPTMAKR